MLSVFLRGMAKMVGLISLAFILPCAADSISIQRVPIVRTELPVGTTWEVQRSSDGISWTNTGVIIAGSGTLDTVRLDGFPTGSLYRMLNTSNTTVIEPLVENGLGLVIDSPRTAAIRVQSNTTLSSSNWAHAGYVFQDGNGDLRSAVPSPLRDQEYLRSVQPAAPLITTSVSSFQFDPSADYAGFGLVEDDMPSLYQQGFVCAPCSEFYHKEGPASAAGECYEFRGPFGAVTAMVAEVIGNPPAGTCDSTGSWFDLGTSAYAALFPESTGFGTTSRRLVPAPVSGNVKLVIVNNSGGYYFELRPYNYTAGITDLEILANGTESFVPLPRMQYNSFVWNGSPPTLPLTVRVTSRFGEKITFPPISSMNTGDRFTATNQFTFPNLEPPTVWKVPDVFADKLNDIRGGSWTTSAYGDITFNPTYTGDSYKGSASFRVNNLGAWSGLIFFHDQLFPISSDGFLEFAVKSGTSTPVTNLAVKIVGSDLTGTATSSAIHLPKIEDSWRMIRIPLGPARAPVRIKQAQFQSTTAGNQGSFLLDSIRFGSYTR